MYGRMNGKTKFALGYKENLIRLRINKSRKGVLRLFCFYKAL